MKIVPVIMSIEKIYHYCKQYYIYQKCLDVLILNIHWRYKKMKSKRNPSLDVRETEIYDKIDKIIGSCESRDHFDVAMAMVELFKCQVSRDNWGLADILDDKIGYLLGYY